jgi:hypothetical protein
MREDGLTLWSRSFPVSSAVFSCISEKCRRNLPKSIRCENLPCVRPSVRFLFLLFLVHSFRLCIFFLLVSKSLRDVVAGAAPPDMKHQVSPADEPNQFAAPICSSCFLSRFRPFYLFLLFFSPLSISKGGRKTGKNRLFFTQNSDRRTISP